MEKKLKIIDREANGKFVGIQMFFWHKDELECCDYSIAIDITIGLYFRAWILELRKNTND